MIGTVWNSHFAASNALFGQFIQNYGQQSVALRGIMRNWDEARIDAFMRLDVNDVRDFYFADLANRTNAWGKLFDNGAETIENALITRYITETNRNAQVVGYVSGTALGRKTFKAINRLTLLAPPSTKPVVFVENMQDLLLSGKLSAEIDNGVVVIKARPDNGAWDEVARLSPDMSDATPVSNFQPADIRQTIYDPATGYSMALVCSGPRCSWVEGACFTAGTPVHTPAGLVPIEKISIGDTVLAYNESSKTPTLAPVTNVFHKTWRGLLRIIAGRDTLLATPNHPFYLPGSGRYLPADSLRRGMQLLALTGALLTVQSVAAVDTTVSVYNFEVAEHHNYYVGEEGVLVHNDCVFVKLGLRNLPQQTPAHPIFDVFTNVFGTTPQATLNRMQFLEDYGRLSGQARADFEAFFRADDLLGANPGITHEALLAARGNRARAWGVAQNTTWKTNTRFLGELSEDLAQNESLEQFFINNPDILELWKTGIRTNSIDELIEFSGRANLREEYIAEVQAISGTANQLLLSGMNIEDIAFEVFSIRREITIRYKSVTPDDLLDWIYEFNNIRYTQQGIGDQWGLTWEGALIKYTDSSGVTDYTRIIQGASTPLGDKQTLGRALHLTIGDEVLPTLRKYRMTELIE